ncbi:MAG TPA: hypothetical protein VFM98_15705, partial [Ramlibacter sp.]|nr:hypothetical protein [Ramlibacter sp.]
LAQRVNEGAATARGQAALSAHLEVARGYGVKFASYEQDGRMRICYDGDAFRRVLALPATPPQQARAVLALTQPACADPALGPVQRHAWNRWRAEVLERVEVKGLPAYGRNRVALRRASVWSTLAYEHARRADDVGAAAAAERAMTELASVQKGELADGDLASAWTPSPRSASPASRTRSGRSSVGRMPSGRGGRLRCGRAARRRIA